MRHLKVTAALVAAAALVSASRAAVISHREELDRVPSLTMVTFTELKLDTTRTVSDLGQPYKVLGLVLPDQMVDPDAAVPGAPGNAAAVSTHVDPTDNATVQIFVFVHPQKALGFNVRDRKATSITVTAYDSNAQPVEIANLKASRNPHYVGFLRKDQDIVRVIIRAPHASSDDAKSSPLEIADVTFAVPDLRGEVNMLSPAPGNRHDIDSYLGADGDGVPGLVGSSGNHAGNLLGYGGDAVGGAASGGVSAGNSNSAVTSELPLHFNQQRGVPGAPDPDDASPPAVDHPAPLIDNPPTNNPPLAPPTLNSVVHLPEPALASLIAIPLVVLGLRRRKAKIQA